MDEDERGGSETWAINQKSRTTETRSNQNPTTPKSGCKTVAPKSNQRPGDRPSFRPAMKRGYAGFDGEYDLSSGSESEHVNIITASINIYIKTFTHRESEEKREKQQPQQQQHLTKKKNRRKRRRRRIWAVFLLWVS
ncbi:hypothetical protein QJS04_geneDACA003814 [Acorus gramineus]|uniref:Uncharacterized protein n=1 Tax=Acorus gramineus TaxID=55184 RepID=A0AAV9BFV2_ACOGR|nr:hypothetical protein QJS04_geneDACA003814 [Acorus gramineus]